MATAMNLGFTISGPDLPALAAALVRHPAYAARPPDRLRVDGKERRALPGWVVAVAETTGRLVAEWGAIGSHRLTYVPGQVLSGRIPGVAADAAAVVEWLASLPFELATFTALDDAWWPDYTPPGFGDLHALLGWGCAFRGAGHDRLVSRRWLDHGPWRLVRGPDDLSLVQFHDLAADEATALAQAQPGHARMGIGQHGGFLQEPYVFRHDVQGLYVAEDRTLVISAADRDVDEIELRDACAARRLRRADPAAPIERIAYLWIDVAVARRHLDALWLRELECWALVDGRRVRLDDAHGPAPSPPAWAR
jgi:hypothetical protein